MIGTLVSPRGDAALVQATFIEQLSDYGTIFDSVNRIIGELNDADHELSAAGQPILTGWVYHYEREMYVIFGLGFLAMVSLLAVYFRNLEGVLVPALVGIVSGIWGFGFAGLLGYNLDPLIIVVPILLVARALSHSVQMCERYFEIYNDTRDVRESCIESLVSLFPPGVVGILSDAAGLFLVAIAPIRLIDKLAYVCGLWSLTLVVTAIVLTFLLLSFFPPPRNVEDVVLIVDEHQRAILRVPHRFRLAICHDSSSSRARGGDPGDQEGPPLFVRAASLESRTPLISPAAKSTGIMGRASSRLMS